MAAVLGAGVPGRKGVRAPEHEHDFVNDSDVAVEFWVVYLVPAGAAPLLNDVATPPRECS